MLLLYAPRAQHRNAAVGVVFFSQSPGQLKNLRNQQDDGECHHIGDCCQRCFQDQIIHVVQHNPAKSVITVAAGSRIAHVIQHLNGLVVHTNKSENTTDHVTQPAVVFSQSPECTHVSSHWQRVGSQGILGDQKLPAVEEGEDCGREAGLHRRGAVEAMQPTPGTDLQPGLLGGFLTLLWGTEGELLDAELQMEDALCHGPQLIVQLHQKSQGQAVEDGILHGGTAQNDAHRVDQHDVADAELQALADEANRAHKPSGPDPWHELPVTGIHALDVRPGGGVRQEHHESQGIQELRKEHQRHRVDHQDFGKGQDLSQFTVNTLTVHGAIQILPQPEVQQSSLLRQEQWSSHHKHPQRMYSDATSRELQHHPAEGGHGDCIVHVLLKSNDSRRCARMFNFSRNVIRVRRGCRPAAVLLVWRRLLHGAFAIR
mmetsp:Transcript_46078/g.73150  ORF Transcript_46078/g.73150 Transcript_46078/m.73150 type:complete len:429 (+) Transcript_46078:178-1464(+)